MPQLLFKLCTLSTGTSFAILIIAINALIKILSSITVLGFNAHVHHHVWPYFHQPGAAERRHLHLPQPPDVRPTPED